MHLPFDNSYAALPDRFFARTLPTPVAAPKLIRLNRPLADLIGLDADWLETPDGLAMLAGRSVPDGADPIAVAYAGHQFGHFVAQLGDGRAVLLGEVVGRDGVRRDVQLKGAGPTPFSRRGDGRAAIGPVLREYIVSEAMAALGIPTTRALAAVATGEAVQRETLLPGGVLTRIAQSHIRIGTFQYFAARGDGEAVKHLADHVIARHYPDARTARNPYRALLEGVIARQAALVARWMHVGFIHGVMNTDNMSVAGETIDYGPCAFLDAYDPAKVFSSIDEMGRYAYGNQPRIALWNLTRLAECLLPLLAEQEDAAVEAAKEALGGFAGAFDAAYYGGMAAKLGLAAEADGDRQLVADWLALLAAHGADYTLAFRRLADAIEPGGEQTLRDMIGDTEALRAWLTRWRARLAQQHSGDRAAAMRAVNPSLIPRNHRIEQVIAAAVADDFEPFARLVEALAEPFAERAGSAAFAQPPRAEECVSRTFCGT